MRRRIERKLEFTQMVLKKLAYSACHKLFHSFLYSSYLRLAERSYWDIVNSLKSQRPEERNRAKCPHLAGWPDCPSP